MDLIFLDTETTNNTEGARLVQLAYKNYTTGEVVDELFKPPVLIDFTAMAVHHITNEMVSDSPEFIGSDRQRNLIDLLSNNILVAHNARFDINILKNEGVETKKYIDTLRVARHLIESEQHRLQYLRYFLNLKVEAKAHDAHGDILVLEELFKYLGSLVKEKFSLTRNAEVIQKMFELTDLPVLLDTLNFGKYKGKTFKEIAGIDRGYLEWLYNSERQKAKLEQNEDLVYTLKNYM